MVSSGYNKQVLLLQELQNIKNLVEKKTNHSLSLSELQNNTNNLSVPNKNNTGIYVALTISTIILGGIFVYFLVHKKKK